MNLCMLILLCLVQMCVHVPILDLYDLSFSTYLYVFDQMCAAYVYLCKGNQTCMYCVNASFYLSLILCSVIIPSTTAYLENALCYQQYIEYKKPI